MILICRNGKPVAELRAVERRKKRNMAPHPPLSNFKAPEDIMEPIDPAIWEALS